MSFAQFLGARNSCCTTQPQKLSLQWNSGFRKRNQFQRTRPILVSIR
jgi:hypothetical protein